MSNSFETLQLEIVVHSVNNIFENTLDFAVEVEVTSLAATDAKKGFIVHPKSFNLSYFISIFIREIKTAMVSFYLISGEERIAFSEIPLFDIPISDIVNNTRVEVPKRNIHTTNLKNQLIQSSNAIIEIGMAFKRKLESVITITDDKTLQLDFDDFKTIQDELDVMMPFASVHTTIYRLAAISNNSLMRGYFHNKVLLQDLLQDIAFISGASDSSLYSEDSEVMNVFETKIRRKNLVLSCSTMFTFTTSKYSKYAPIELNCVQLNVAENCLRYYLLKFTNRYSMWLWVKWLHVVFRVWNGESEKDSLPYWVLASNGKYNCPITIFFSDGQLLTGNCSISIDKPFKIQCDEKTVKISPLKSMIISIDSVIPRSHSLEVNVTSCSMKADSDDEVETSIDTESYENVLVERKKGRSKLSNIKGNLFGIRRKSSILRKENTPKAEIGSDTMKSYLTLNIDGMNIRTKKFSSSSVHWNSLLSIDIDMNSANLTEESPISGFHTMDLFLFSGKDGSEDLIKQKYVPVNLILNNRADNEVNTDIVLDSLLGK